ncbi:MAG: tetratricopeptide repeat protein [Anaerolineae bacterium]|nr:tetratricopeptide repeat protein [Anaerolineae bacterium]
MGFRRFFEALLGVDSEAPRPVTEMQRWQNALVAGSNLRRQGKAGEALQAFEAVLAEAEASGNAVAKATALGHIGALFTDQRRWDDAARVLGQAVEIAREQQNPTLLAAVLNDYGQYQLAREEHLAARESYEEALTHAREGNDNQLTAHILAGLAGIYLEENNASYAHRLLEEANQLTRFQVPAFVGQMGQAALALGHEADGHRMIVQALRLSNAFGNVEQEVRWALALARRYRDDGKLREAERLHQRVANLLKRGVRLTDAQYLDYHLDRAELEMVMGRTEDAVRYAQEAIDLADQLGRSEAAVRAQGLLGALYRARGEAEKAAEHLHVALEQLPADADLQQRLQLQLEFVRVQQTIDPEAALETYRELVEAARRAEAPTELARALTYLGRFRHGRGEYQPALEAWREAAALYEEQGESRRLAPLLCDIANILRDRGDHKQALTLYEQALVALNNVKDPATRGLVLSNVANMYTDTGDAETAQSFYEDAIQIARDTGDRAAESLRLGNLGWFYVLTGQPRDAVDALEKALKISSQLEQPLLQAVQRDNLASAHARLGDYTAAESLHRQALALVEDQGEKRWEGVFHSNYGETLARSGQHEEALAHFEKALALAHEADDNLTSVRTLWRLADLQREMQEFEAAQANYKKAINNAQAIGAQRDLALATLGQGLLAQARHQTEQARAALDEANRLLSILHAPESKQAAQALAQLNG